MSSLRNGRSGTARPWLLLLLALFAVAATGCNDLEATPPLEVPDDSSEAISEDPAGEEASDPAADDATADDGAAPDDGAEGVEPITADDVEAVCADEDARATTADELAPLVGLTPQSFEALACDAVEQ